MMNIRRATRDDIPGMMQLIHELALYEKMPEEVTVDLTHFEESGFGSNPVWWAFVVEEYNVEDSSTSSTSSTLQPIVAFALYYIRYSTWKGQVMYLEDILVTESMRGMGIGKLLMDRLIEEAKVRGFKKMTWQVLDWNQPAIDFYKKYDVQFDPTWINVALEI